jgi:hypothetical protein
VRMLLVVVVGSLLVGGCGNAGLTCADATSLETVVTCVREQMPARESNGYVAPTDAQRADWRAVVDQMLQGTCDFPAPSNLAGIVQVRTFRDTDNGRAYCLLMEVRDQDGNGTVDHGFGTFIVYAGATRQLSHQAVHPIADSTTDSQAVTVFKATGSRSFLMAGAHRDANARASTCCEDFPESDASHNSNTMVQATNEALLDYYGEASWFAIQWHGMAASTCSSTDVYPTHGVDVTPAPTDRIAVLRDNVRSLHPTWDVDLPGSGSCGLNATENIQGRLLNGVAADSVCRIESPTYTQRFIHIEQDPDFRNPSDWIAAIEKTFPD